jgi:hypothetical protein
MVVRAAQQQAMRDGKAGRTMRLMAALMCGTLAACASGGVTVPDDAVLYEVPMDGTASTTGGDPFTARIEGALESGDPSFAQLSPQERAQALTPGATPMTDDRIVLMQWTLEQQKIDAAVAERELAEDRAQLVVVQPGALPNRVEGANVALYAQQTSNAVGERRYDRSGFRAASSCGRYRSADDAQRAFLGAGGPGEDRLGLDPDGDGFACRWDPTPYRELSF